MRNLFFSSYWITVSSKGGQCLNFQFNENVSEIKIIVLLFSRQHVSDKENEAYEDASADKEEIGGSGDMDEEETKHIAEENATVSAGRTKPRNLIKMVLEESKDAEREEKLRHENDEENSGHESGSPASFVQGSGEIGAYHEGEHLVPKPHPKNVPQISNSSRANDIANESDTLKPHPKHVPQISNSSSAKDVANESEPLHNETHLRPNDQVEEVDDHPNKKSATSKSKSKVEIKSKDLKTKVHKDASQNKEKVKEEERSKGKTEHTSQVQDAELHKKNMKKAPIRVSKVSHLAKKRLHNKYMTAHVTHPHVVESHPRVVHKMPVGKGTVCHAILEIAQIF